MDQESRYDWVMFSSEDSTEEGSVSELTQVVSRINFFVVVGVGFLVLSFFFFFFFFCWLLGQRLPIAFRDCLQFSAA